MARGDAFQDLKDIIEEIDSYTAPTRGDYGDVFTPTAAVTVKSSPVVGKKEATPSSGSALSNEYTSMYNALAACPNHEDQCGTGVQTASSSNTVSIEP